MTNPLSNLNYSKLAPSDNGFKICHNQPRFLDKDFSGCSVKIVEQNNEETVFLTSDLSDGECAIVGSECRPDGIDEGWKRTDIMYLFVSSKTNEARSYAYDMKLHVGKSENDIYRLIKQCSDTSRLCDSIYERACQKTPDYKEAPVQMSVGVVTETYDEERLDWWISKRSELPVSPTPSNFFEQKIQAQAQENSKYLKILQDFKNKKARINGTELPFDIRFFENKNATLNFIHGILQ